MIVPRFQTAQKREAESTFNLFYFISFALKNTEKKNGDMQTLVTRT